MQDSEPCHLNCFADNETSMETPVETRRSMMPTPDNLSTNQSQECPLADHTLFLQNSSLPPAEGTQGLEGMSLLWPCFLAKLFFSTSPKTFSTISIQHQWTEARFHWGKKINRIWGKSTVINSNHIDQNAVNWVINGSLCHGYWLVGTGEVVAAWVSSGKFKDLCPHSAVVMVVPPKEEALPGLSDASLRFAQL